MKNIIYLLIPILAIIFLYSGCTKSEKQGKDDKSLTPVKEYWTCSMHPQVRMDKPGACPICGMDLIKKIDNDKGSGAGETNDSVSSVTLSGRKQVLANVSTVRVTKETLKKEVAVYSYLDFAEQSRKIISARFNGRIEKLLVDKTGDYVKKGQALFEIYSPDLVQAQNDYLLALSNNENISLATAAKSKLELFGLTNTQIKEIETGNKVKSILTYYSPVSGTVIEKKVREGMYVNEGTALYDIAELSSLWSISEVNEKDLASVKVGNTVKLNLKAYPQEVFIGKVTFIYPVVNSQSRTVKVRSEFSNTAGKLKPQMYGETVFSINAGQGLLVPAGAIIFSGKRTIVWVKMPDGMFEGHLVTVGDKYGDKYQVLAGLNENDEVAASGGFLIDSESQLKTGTKNK